MTNALPLTAQRQRGFGWLLMLFCGLLAGPAGAQSVIVTGPTGSGAFGTRVVGLPSGNYVVTDPSFDQGGQADVGAVYLYRGSNNTIISTLTGSRANDRVGSGEVFVLTNGNFVVASPDWSNSTAASVGAATWGSGSTGVSGVVSAANSMVGAQANDQVGGSGIYQLINGNYVVSSESWHNGSAANAGAATWASGTGGTVGVVSAANSLVGSTGGDKVGALFTIKPLTNGNYVVGSRTWNNGGVLGAGAATWGSGTAGVRGPISPSNSLVGSQQNDFVGDVVTALTNGHYVVGSPYWSNGSVSSVGAATWANGSTGLVGTVSTANSLVGTQANDQVSGGFGGSGIIALTNGHYVVASPEWASVGAATWGNGTSGTVGTVSAANSLVGSRGNDRVVSRITALTNGHYVVGSPSWANGAAMMAGAATWANGTGGTTGAVSASNSLVGSHTDDQVGIGTGARIALPSGAYAFGSGYWDNGAVVDVGAVTLGNAAGITTGPLTSCNSVLGTVANAGSRLVLAYNPVTDKLLVGLPAQNQVAIGLESPAAPTGAAVQYVPATATVASLAATGQSIRWYTVPTGGSALASTTALTDGRTYYATQTVNGCESIVRLAVTAYLAPVITSLSATSGPEGTIVTLTGVRFYGVTGVSFNGMAVTFTVVNATTVTVTVPVGATSGNVVITTAAGPSNGVPFSVTPAITALSPGSGAMGSTFTLTGTSLAGTTSVRLGGQPAAFVINSATSLTVTVPAGASTHRVQVSTPGGSTLSAAAFGVNKANSYNFPLVTANFNSIDVSAYAAPTFTDLDGDGLLDMLVGKDNGTLAHYRQAASNSLSFVLVTSFFNSIIPGDYVTPTVTDLDGDGRLDMLVGKSDGTLAHYQQAAPNSGSFALVANTFNSINVGTFAVPALHDLDGDGRLDLLVGGSDGMLAHYEQASANSLSFALVTTAFSGIDVGSRSAPTVTDLDGDGRLDLLVGKSDGTLSHYEQVPPVPVITALNPASGPVGTSLTITGTGLRNAISVKINGRQQTTIISNTDNSLTVLVSANAVSGPVTVTTTGGTSTPGTQTFDVTPTLSNLTLSAGALSPAFASGTFSYTLSTAAASTTVTPTNAQTSGGTLTVNGTTLNSGSASGAIALSPGSNTITVGVKPDGSGSNTTIRTYTVTALASNISLVLDANSNASTTAAAVNNGSSSTCGAVTWP